MQIGHQLISLFGHVIEYRLFTARNVFVLDGHGPYVETRPGYGLKDVQFQALHVQAQVVDTSPIERQQQGLERETRNVSVAVTDRSRLNDWRLKSVDGQLPDLPGAVSKRQLQARSRRNRWNRKDVF